MVTIQDKSTILIYKVGPVLCCAPCISIISITQPVPLTKLPGQKAIHSGIFKFGTNLVNVCELRKNFGVVPEQWLEPGRMIITELSSGFVGFWVDKIIDVLESPNSGWGTPPPLIPKATFSRTLNFNDKIHLYAEFENLYAIKQTDYLKSYIEHLNKLKFDIDKKINKTSIENSNKNEIIEIDNNSRDTLDNKIIKNNITDNPKIISASTCKTNKKNTEEITINSNQEQLNTVYIKTNTKFSKIKSASSSTIDIKNLNPLIDKKIKKIINTHENKQGKHSQKSATIRKPSKILSLPNTATENSEIPFNKENEFSYSYNIGNAEQSFNGVFIAFSLILLLLIAGYFYTSFDNTPPVTKIISNETKNKIISKNISVRSDATIINKVEEFNTNKIIEENKKDSKLTKIENTKKYINNSMKSTKSANNTTVDNNKELSKNNHTSTYSANISKNKNDITITLYTPITNEKISSLKTKTEDTGLTKNTVKPENEKKVNLISNSKQYKIKIQSNKNQNIDPSIISKEIIHIVVKGDTLWHIAKFYVKDPYRYPELARLSNIKNPDLIYPGNRVHIIQIFTNKNIQNE